MGLVLLVMKKLLFVVKCEAELFLLTHSIFSG
jgi:hypothetical protein